MYIQMHVHIYIFLFTSGRDERQSRVLFVTNAVSLALLQPLCVLNAPPLPISSNHHLFWNVETFHRATFDSLLHLTLVSLRCSSTITTCPFIPPRRSVRVTGLPTGPKIFSATVGTGMPITSTPSTRDKMSPCRRSASAALLFGSNASTTRMSFGTPCARATRQTMPTPLVGLRGAPLPPVARMTGVPCLPGPVTEGIRLLQQSGSTAAALQQLSIPAISFNRLQVVMA
mmetsp:Transcript_93484/g.150924  ORF Transcript_93484/g.150924 Transcript_93484/m.150924 type:complete len:229 (-) Transcript_93484:30-716(-)